MDLTAREHETTNFKIDAQGPGAARRPWQTPNVIVSDLPDTENAAGAASDGTPTHS